MTPDALRAALAAQHDNIAAAVHGVLRQAGLEGVTMHSVRLVTPRDFDDPCDQARNPETEKCVLDSNNGTVTHVCVPK
ncbi:MAG: hypothetical protein ABSG65_04680 [Bryobacteraceae bacterium]|jgi:hypothetical protein